MHMPFLLLFPTVFPARICQPQRKIKLIISANEFNFLKKERKITHYFTNGKKNLQKQKRTFFNFFAYTF